MGSLSIRSTRFAIQSAGHSVSRLRPRPLSQPSAVTGDVDACVGGLGLCASAVAVDLLGDRLRNRIYFTLALGVLGSSLLLAVLFRQL